MINGSKNYQLSESKLFDSLNFVGFLDNDQLHDILSSLVQKQYLLHDLRSGLYSPSPKLKSMIQLGRIYGNINSSNENKSLKDLRGARRFYS